MTTARTMDLTFGQVQVIKARFRDAWQTLRDNPLPADAMAKVSRTSGMMIVCAWPGTFRVWTEWVDEEETLDPVVARKVLMLRSYFPIDMKTRAVIFGDPELDLFEIAEIGVSGPLPVWIRANLPFRRDPSLTPAELELQGDRQLAECWAALPRWFSSETPPGVPPWVARDAAAAGEVLQIVHMDGWHEGDLPSIECVEREDVDDYHFGEEERKHLPNDGKLRAVAYSDMGMDRWEIRRVYVNGKLGPVEASGRDPETADEHKPRLRLIKGEKPN